MTILGDDTKTTEDYCGQEESTFLFEVNEKSAWQWVLLPHGLSP